MEEVAHTPQHNPAKIRGKDNEPPLITDQKHFDSACEYIIAHQAEIVVTYNGGETVPDNCRYKAFAHRRREACMTYFSFSTRHADSYVLIYHQDDLNTPLYKIGVAFVNGLCAKAFGIRVVNQSDPLELWNSFKICEWRSMHAYGRERKKKATKKRSNNSIKTVRRRVIKKKVKPDDDYEEEEEKPEALDHKPEPVVKNMISLDEIYRLCQDDPTYSKAEFLADVANYY